LNTKALIDLPNWPQFNAVTTGLRLLRQVHIDTPVFTKPSLLGKRHIVVQIPWPINYWVIDKDTSVKAYPPHVKSVDLTLTMDETNNKSNIAFKWLPTTAALTIMDPNQPRPLIKLPISIEQESLQFRTNVLIDTEATLNFCEPGIFDTKQYFGEVYSWSKNRCSNCKRTEDFH
jgi:hypothetical protein